jgi:hypothetical protein
MQWLVKGFPVACLTIALSTAPVWANATRLHSQIEALRAPNHYWHRIAWKKSLIEGLTAARATNKPVLVWAFIDNPDEERC